MIAAYCNGQALAIKDLHSSLLLQGRMAAHDKAKAKLRRPTISVKVLNLLQQSAKPAHIIAAFLQLCVLKSACIDRTRESPMAHQPQSFQEGPASQRIKQLEMKLLMHQSVISAPLIFLDFSQRQPFSLNHQYSKVAF